ncbi:MAG: hypothetical protein NTY19_06900 [Planctomycetota bacterium]|nr:hypothetical protein [Planctomycetota bacterium]
MLYDVDVLLRRGAIVGTDSELYRGASFQLPLCIAAWALVLWGATDDGSYLEKPTRYHYTGSVHGEYYLDGVEEKAKICKRSGKWGRDFLVALDPREWSPPFPRNVKHVTQFDDAFALAFAGCLVSDFNAARQVVKEKYGGLCQAPPQRRYDATAQISQFLTRHAADVQIFRSVCQTLKVPVSAECLRATANERWASVARFCDDKDRLRELVFGAVGRCQTAGLKAQAEDLLAGQTDIDGVSAVRWPTRGEAIEAAKRVEGHMGRMRPKPGNGRRVNDFVGTYALLQTWASETDDCSLIQVSRQLQDSFDDAFSKQVEDAAKAVGLVDDSYRFYRPEDQLSLAADFVVRCSEQRMPDGVEFVRRLLDRAGDPGTTASPREELLQLVLRWWHGGRQAAADWTSDQTRKSFQKLPQTEEERLFRLLTRVDQLLREAGVVLVDELAAMPSCQLAYRLGLVEHRADFLEQIGERRLGVYGQMLDQARGMQKDHAYLVPLARSMRRLIEEGADTAELPDSPLRRALSAAIPKASTHELDQLTVADGSLGWWLDVMPWTANQAQLEFLCRIYRQQVDRGDREQKRAQKAATALAAQFDVAAVCQCLGEDVGRWVAELTPLERAGPNVIQWLERSAFVAPRKSN